MRIGVTKDSHPEVNAWLRGSRTTEEERKRQELVVVPVKKVLSP